MSLSSLKEEFPTTILQLSLFLPKSSEVSVSNTNKSKPQTGFKVKVGLSIVSLIEVEIKYQDW